LTQQDKIDRQQQNPAENHHQRLSPPILWTALQFLAMILLMGSLILYRTQWGKSHLNENIFIGLTGFSLIGLIMIWRRITVWNLQINLLKNIRANLAAIIPDAPKNAYELLRTLKPLPAKSKTDPLVKGWNHLINTIEQAANQSQTQQSGQNLNAVFSSYESQRLSKLFDALSNGVILADTTGSVVMANRACEGMLSRSLSQMVDHSIFTLFDDPNAKSAFQKLLDKQALENTQVFEMSRTTESQDDESSIFQITGQRINTVDTNSDILIVVRDMTQQKISESSQSDFVAHVSHELRSPLANIRAYSETLLSDMVLDANTQKEAFNVINDETVRLTRMINNVLDLSQMETGSMRFDQSDVATDKLFRQCLNDIKAMATSKNITLQTNFHPKIQNLYTDRDKLSIVLNNVLSNAIKYTPEGGTVFFETNQDEEFIYVKITDTGYGIPAADIDRIFEKFYRVQNEDTATITGTGLGLSTCKEIITQMGGAIDVTSELGKGTEMTVKLPLTTIGPVLGPAVNKG